jgi:hypothetical protein
MKRSYPFPLFLICGLSLLSACGGGDSSAAPPPAATHFSVSAPARATSGIAFPATVTALDASNQAVTSYSGTVHLTSSDGQAGLPGNSTLTNGTGTFAVTLKTAGSQTITATDSATAMITGTSTSVTVDPSAATHLSLAVQPTVTVGTAFSVTVTALDNSNNAVTTYSGTVHVTSTDGQAGLPGNSVLADGTGKLSVTLNTLGSQTITATDMMVPSITGTSKAIQVFSVLASGFTATGSMLIARESHTATLLNDGTVLVAGGSCRPPIRDQHSCTGLQLNALASAEIFNPGTGAFTSTADMSVPRFGHTATLLGNGKVLVAGGDDIVSTVYTTAELYDPATGRFASTANNMTFARSGHTATLLANGTVLLAGGAGTSSSAGPRTAELFDPATGKFTVTGTMSASRFFHTATLLSDGRVLLTGGDSSGLAAEIYAPATGTFSPTGSMHVARTAHTATLLTSGKVLVLGGASTNGATASVELFDPVTGVFALAGNMLSAREDHAATKLADGSVLVTGGRDGTTALSSGELFDPLTGGVTLAGNMETARYQHASTLLANGKLLVTGGFNFEGVPGATSLASAEIGGFGPAPGTVTLRPQTMAFGCHTGVGLPPGCSLPELATLTNTSTTPVYTLGVAISPASAFHIQSNDCPKILTRGQSCAIVVWFDGAVTGRGGGPGTTAYTGALFVSDTTSDSPQTVMLTGISRND